MATSCANHTCGKALDVSERSTQANVLCPLCLNQEAVYCSNECRMMDWLTHNCPNAIAASSDKVTTLFRPYYLEDLMTDKEWADVQDKLEFEQTYQLQRRHAGSMQVQVQAIDATIKWRSSSPVLETAFRRGVDPQKYLKLLADMPYTVTVSASNDASVTLSGKIAEDAIYENHMPSRFGDKKDIGKLLNAFFSRRKESSSLTLFPAVDVDQARANMFPVQGEITIQVAVNGREIASHTGQYLMRTWGFEATRAFTKFLVPRLKLLFPLRDDAIKNIKILRADVAMSNFVLFFDVPRTGFKEQRRIRSEEPDEGYITLRGVILTMPNAIVQNRALRGTTSTASTTMPEVMKNTPPPPPPAGKTKPTAVVPAPAPASPPPVPAPPVTVAPPPPPKPSPGTATSTSGETLAEQVKRGRKLNPTPPPSPPMTRDSPGQVVPEALVVAMAKRSAAVHGDGDDDDDDDDSGEDGWGNGGGVMCYSTSCSTDLFFPTDEPETPTTAAGGTADLKYEVDPMDLSTMTGLAMALDLHAAQKTLPEELDKVAAIVQDHARALGAGKVASAEDVPLNVSTAIYTVVNSLWEQ